MVHEHYFSMHCDNNSLSIECQKGFSVNGHGRDSDCVSHDGEPSMTYSTMERDVLDSVTDCD